MGIQKYIGFLHKSTWFGNIFPEKFLNHKDKSEALEELQKECCELLEKLKT
ncbi:hypothetical protein CPJCM30710_16180 [Clostridium polyendosporum]|uniref:Uncharacterized protein n=1 Tax=Clostridium polyendosporum TaxID=69208 RepID=A0A919VG92_9CLOT|nr:hypothetical protein [Clostridium polyendosporum]GIM28952.1 hypothetical protein CPJCM30710_16180 [Clostridium polyendosporum]